MIGVVVVTHGQLATELVNAAEMIVGDLPQFAAVSIGWHDDVNDAREDIAQAIEHVRSDDGVLLLTDMFGGTPSNLAMTFLETDRLEVITGVNLPMLLRLAGLRSSSNLLAVAREMRDHGRHAMWVASDLMRGERDSAAAGAGVMTGGSRGPATTSQRDEPRETTEAGTSGRAEREGTMGDRIDQRRREQQTDGPRESSQSKRSGGA